VEVEHLRAREGEHALRCADDGESIRVLPVGGREHRLGQDATRTVLGAPDLLEDHLLLALELRLVEGGVLHRVGEHVDADGGVAARHRDVVDRHVERGERVDVPPRRLDRARDLADLAPLGPLEEHVLEDVRHASLGRELVGASHVHPDVERDDGRRVIFSSSFSGEVGFHPGRAVPHAVSETAAAIRPRIPIIVLPLRPDGGQQARPGRTARPRGVRRGDLG
jgi:hypothetical protein